MSGGHGSIEDVLAREGMYVTSTAGASMWPLLRDRRDTAVIHPLTRAPRVGDVVLFRHRGRYVLHRVARVRGEVLDIIGDNCLAYERGVARADVVGVLAGLHRDKREVDLEGPVYRAYVLAVRVTRPLHRALLALRATARRRMRGGAR